MNGGGGAGGSRRSTGGKVTVSLGGRGGALGALCVAVGALMSDKSVNELN